jgi:hypothetical protein
MKVETVSEFGVFARKPGLYLMRFEIGRAKPLGHKRLTDGRNQLLLSGHPGEVACCPVGLVQSNRGRIFLDEFKDSQTLRGGKSASEDAPWVGPSAHPPSSLRIACATAEPKREPCQQADPLPCSGGLGPSAR